MFTTIGSRAGRNRRSWSARSMGASNNGVFARAMALDITGPYTDFNGFGNRSRFAVEFVQNIYGQTSGGHATAIHGGEYNGGRGVLLMFGSTFMFGSQNTNAGFTGTDYQSFVNNQSTNITPNTLSIPTNGWFGFGFNSAFMLDATGVMALRNNGGGSSSPQAFRVYGNTGNISTNFTRATFAVSVAGVLTISTEADGITNFVGPISLAAPTVKVGTNTTVASLTAAATAGVGARAFVTDATSSVFGATVVGGGANGVPVYSDGINWRIG